MPVLLAAVLITLIGMAGLAVDFGFAALERRVLQNAVDAAAVTGANGLARGVGPSADVQTMATRNSIAVSTTVVCEYVDNANAVTGPCSAAPSATTSGVKVTATNDRPTYFMRALGVPWVTVSASAMARVFTVAGGSTFDSWGAVFIVCGWGTTEAVPRVNGNGYTYQQTDLLAPLAAGSTYPASWPYGTSYVWPLSSESGPTSVYNKRFVVHDENDVAKCGIGDSGFKGLNSSSGTFAVPSVAGASWAPTAMTAETGSRSGPATTPVPTYQGCGSITNADDPALHNCVMFLPIFTSTLDPPNDKVNGDYRVRTVRWQPFWIEKINSNTHFATPLRSANIVANESTILAPWTRNSNAIVTAVRTVQ